MATAAHPVVAGQIADFSCEPSFGGGDCNNYCLDLWRDYCYQRHPRGRVHSHRRCLPCLGLGGCGLGGCGHGGHCGSSQGCDSNPCGCSSDGGSTPAAGHPEPAPAEDHHPPAPPEPTVDISAEIQPPSSDKVRSYETTPVTPPELRDPPIAPNPPEPPLNDLPRNELPLLPVAQKAVPMVIELKPSDIAAAPVPRAVSILTQPYQPPLPSAGETEISNSGSLRLVEHLSDVSEVR